MKSSKKLLMLLTVALLMLVVSACGRNDDEPRPEATPAPTPTAGQATPAPLPAPVVPEGEPREIRIVGFYIHELHGAAPEEEPVPGEVADYELARMQYDNRRAVEERFNVRIVHLDTMDYDVHWEQFLAQQMAGDPMGEIVLLSGRMLLNAMLGGHLTNLRDVTFPGSDLHGDRTYIVATSENADGIWQVTTRTGGDVWSSVGLGVNMELVRRLGLPDPIELYEAGMWNWENFLTIMRTATAQGYFGISGVLNDIGNGLVMANDGIFVTPDLNFGFDHPNTMEALELFATLLEERLWMYDRDGDVPIPEDDWWRQMTGFDDGQSVFFSTFLWVPGMIGGTDIDFRLLPFPTGPSNRSGNTWGSGYQQAVVIPAGVEDPALVLQVMEALMAWPGDDLWLIEEATRAGMTDVVLTQGDIDRWLELTNNQRAIDVGFDVGDYEYIFSPLAQDVFHGLRTIAESVEYHRGPYQEMLDNMFR